MNIGAPEIALTLAVISAGVAVLGYTQKRDVLGRLVALETKVEPIWKVIEQEVFKGLRSNPDSTHIERDRLIDKYLSRVRLSRDEARYLAQEFIKINEGKGAGNKGLAVLGLAVLASKYGDDIEDMLRP